MAGKFVVIVGNDGKHYFNLKAGNGEIILASQGYKDKTDCLNGIESVKRNSAEDSRFQTKKSQDDKDYFVLVASNGQTIGKSQMYKAQSDCSNGIASVQRNAAEAQVVEELS